MERLGIKAFGSNESEMKERNVCRFTLSPISKEGKEILIEAFVVDHISSIANVHVENVKNKFPHLHKIFFTDVSRFDETLDIQILIGSDYLWNFHEGEIIRGGQNEPVAVKTSLGWTLSGPLKGEKLNFQSDVNVNHVNVSLSDNIDKLWDLETIGIRPTDEVHEGLIDNIEFTGERYSVGLPWKVGHGPLQTNYDISLSRLKRQLRKLRQTPTILESYDQVIKEQLQSGIIEQVAELENPSGSSKIHYLPHHAVVRDSVETTKVRVVYDASCKSRKSAVSLNDCLHVGPSLTPMLFDILLRFRTNKVALVGDIEKAFLNIEVCDNDRDCLRFLWVDDVNAPEPQILVFRFKRVVFGVNSSPFLLNAVLRHHIQMYSETDPEFVKKVTESFYVDDLVSGAGSVEQAYSLYERVRSRMKEGGFTVRKFKTNDTMLAEMIEEKEGECEKKDKGSGNETSVKEHVGLSQEIGGKTKVLGIPWDTKTDTLQIDFEKVEKINHAATKRGILKALASLFDPHGLISPVVVTAKILFQELCIDNYSWDDPLPVEKFSRWKAWLQDLQEASHVSVSRNILVGVEGEILKTSLHGFGDASQKSYCAVVYLVIETAKGVYSKILCAKTRVAPLKNLSIPRLELMSARILVTLVDAVRQAIQSEINIDTVRYWLDSKTALYWIQNNNEWKTFVQHRVNEILSLSKKEEWGHVPGVENPADLGTRGVTAKYLKESELWWQAPKWLSQGEQGWPKRFQIENPDGIEEERKKVITLSVHIEEQKGISKIIDIDSFSALHRLLRVTALVMRFIRNCRNKKEGTEISVGNVKAEEMKEAERLWILDCQSGLQNDSKFQKVSKQLGIVKKDGVYICVGRLDNSDLEIEAKNPIFLPKDHRFAKLIVLYCHETVHHSRVKGTLAELRSRFWITQGRQFVKKIIKPCVTCKRLEGKSYGTPPIAPLPDFRVTKSPPFYSTGVDFAGPLYIKGSDGKMNKAYIALFTCCVTRAVHIELVENLLASTFVNCLRRFCSRRGTPNLLISDNAKTFKATDKVLKKLCESDKVQHYMTERRITWKFILERSPWMAGFYERLVGSVKRCLRKVLANARLSFDEINTVLTEIEFTLNSRPLTYLYDDLEEVLTPFHLLFGSRLFSLSEGLVDNEDCEESNTNTICKRFLYLSRKLTHFWNRWRREYLKDLRETHSQQKKSNNEVNKGDIVLIFEENTKRNLWKTGIVEDLIVGRDGVVRGATVCKIGRGGKHEVLNRPLQKLFPLEVSNKVDRDDDKRESNEEGLDGEENVGKISGDSEVNEEKTSLERPERGMNRTPRVAALDARCKTKFMLDSS